MSRVVEICAEAMFAPVAAQAPANNMRSSGLSLVTSVSSVSDRNASLLMAYATGCPSVSKDRISLACCTCRSRSVLSQ